jgi:hypothetical protein
MVGSKQPSPVWLTPEEADKHCRAGASIWPFASTEKGVDPDVVLCGIGAEMMFEVIAAAALLRKLVPELRVRVINVTDLMVLGEGGSHPHALSNDDFDALFTEDKPIHFNYHGIVHLMTETDEGYRTELQGLLFHRPNLDRVSIEGYNEEGTTTTPFSMMLLNRTSRYHVAEAAVRGGSANPKVAVRRQELLASFGHAIKKAKVLHRMRLTNLSNMLWHMEWTQMTPIISLNLMIGNLRKLNRLQQVVIRPRNSLSIRFEILCGAKVLGTTYIFIYNGKCLRTSDSPSKSLSSHDSVFPRPVRPDKPGRCPFLQEFFINSLSQLSSRKILTSRHP